MQYARLLIVVKLSGPGHMTAASLQLFSWFGCGQALHMLFTPSAYLLCTFDCCHGGVLHLSIQAYFITDAASECTTSRVCTCIHIHAQFLMLASNLF